MNIYIPYTRLPSEYQEVEYIENTGTTQVQYIDTWVTATANISMELVMTPNTSYTNWEYAIMGTDWTSQWIFLMFYNNVWRYHQWGSYWDISWISDAKTTVAMSSTWFSVNWTSTSFSVWSDYTRWGTILLFTTRSVSTNPSRYKVSKFKTYELKIWDSWTLVRDLVPCYRKSDSVIWMYDIVNSVFYTNQWTGTFTKWADVYSVEVKNIYIGEYKEWKPWANTLAYYPLETDTKDYSWNGRDGTNSNVTFSNGIATFNGNNAMVTIPHSDRQKPTANFTISVRAKATSWSASEWWAYMIVAKQQFWAQNYQNFYYSILINWNKYAGGGITNWNSWSTFPWDTNISIWLNERHLYVLTNNGTEKTLYLDWQQIGQATENTISSSFSVPLTIGNASSYNHNAYFNWNISKVIFEDKTWTAQEISDYYNQTKSNYWL